MSYTKNRFFSNLLRTLCAVLVSTALFAYRECGNCSFRFNKDSYKNCERCGASFSHKEICNSCGFENDASMEYCLECGSKIKGAKIVRSDSKKTKKKEKKIEKNDYPSSKTKLYEKFQKDYTDHKTDHYSLKQLLTIMNMKGDVSAFVKAGDISGGSWGSSNYVSIALIDHYQKHSLPRAVMGIVKKRLEEKPQLKNKLYGYIKSSDKDIKISAMVISGYIKELREKDNFLSLMIKNLSDRDSDIQLAALVNITKKIKKGYLNQRFVNKLTEIVRDHNTPLDLYESAVNAYVVSADKHQDLGKELKHKEEAYQSYPLKIEELEKKNQEYQQKEKELKSKDMKKMNKQKIADNNKLIREYKQQLLKLKVELPPLRKSYQRKDKVVNDGLRIMRSNLKVCSEKKSGILKQAIEDLERLVN